VAADPRLRPRELWDRLKEVLEAHSNNIVIGQNSTGDQPP